MHFFYDSVILFTKRCSVQASTLLSTRSFCESILFVHLKVLRGGELRLVRSWNGQTWRDPLRNVKQKIAL